MDATALSLSRQPSHSSAFRSALSLEELRERAPAAFAIGAHERTSRSYRFISTVGVLNALAEAGFMPVEARQSSQRAASPLHARHLIRLRPRVETIRLRDSIAELLLLNSHDASGASRRVVPGRLPEWSRGFRRRLPGLARGASGRCGR